VFKQKSLETIVGNELTFGTDGLEKLLEVRSRQQIAACQTRIGQRRCVYRVIDSNQFVMLIRQRLITKTENPALHD
jgi:hypothetical protein